MKAVDYLDKWYDKLIIATSYDNNEESKVLAEIITDFGAELISMKEQRNAHKDKAMIALIKEQNQKYNKFCRLVNEKLGQSYLKEDGLKKYWINQNPFLEKYFR